MDVEEAMKAAERAHRRIDELALQVVRLEGQIPGLAQQLTRLEGVPSRLASIEAKLSAIEARLPQHAAPISPWSILMMVLGWGVSILLAVVAWMRS